MSLEVIHNEEKREKLSEIIRSEVTISNGIEKNKKEIDIGKIWTNNNTKVIKNIYCVVPYSILQIMNSFEERMSTKNIEFAIFVKGEMKDNILYIKEDFYVPEQEVTSVAIDFKEDHKGYNGVIHRHPTGCKGFSSTDETYINQNFEFSLLYEDKKIIKGIYNLDVPNFGRVRLDLDINFSYKEMPSLKKFEHKIFTTKRIFCAKKDNNSNMDLFKDIHMNTGIQKFNFDSEDDDDFFDEENNQNLSTDDVEDVFMQHHEMGVK